MQKSSALVIGFAGEKQYPAKWPAFIGNNQATVRSLPAGSILMTVRYVSQSP
jgi:hypothetical protein